MDMNDKTVVVVVNDVPVTMSDKVLVAVKAKFPSFETKGGKEATGPVTHQTNFALAGLGDYRRIEHCGRLNTQLRSQITSFVSGVIWACENPVA